MKLPDKAVGFLALLIGKSKNTKKTYISIITKFHDFIGKEDFDENDILKYLTYLESKKFKPSSIRLAALVLRMYAKFFRKDTSKVRSIKLKSEPKNIYIKEEDLKRFLDSFDNLRDKLIARFILFTGCRVGEVANLHIEDIDFNKRIIKIVDHGKYEIKKQRIIPIDEETLEMLKKVILNRKSGPVFNIGVRSIQKIIKNAALKAKLPYAKLITPHKLRHTMAINWITKGGDIRTLQIILGHGSLKTTEVYLDYDLDNVKKIYNEIIQKMKIK